MVEVIEAVALAVEHAHDFIAHHERNGQLRARGLRRADVARVLAHVGGVDWPLLQDRGAGDALMLSQANLVLAGIPADLRADAQLLRLLVEQQDGDVRQMKISRARWPGFSATPRPNQRWRAPPGPLQREPRVSAWSQELYDCGRGGYQGSESNRFAAMGRLNSRNPVQPAGQAWQSGYRHFLAVRISP